MTNAEAIALAIEALRADAESADCSGPLADPDSAARDRAAADAIESFATSLGLLPFPDGWGEDDAEEFPEDRITRLGDAASTEDFADAIRESVGGERLRTAAAACGILAARLASDPKSFTEDERLELADAIRDDWTIPDR